MTNKLDGYKVGDPVRVVFEGVVSAMPPRVGIKVSEGFDHVWIGHSSIPNKDHFTIERIAPPITVGMRVRWGPERGVVLCIDGDVVFVRLDEGVRAVRPLEYLAPE